MEVAPQTLLYILSLFLFQSYHFYPLQILNSVLREVGSGSGQLTFSLLFFFLQLCEFVQKDELKPAVTQLLWERATEKVPCSPLERCSSVMLLGMMAG